MQIRLSFLTSKIRYFDQLITKPIINILWKNIKVLDQTTNICYPCHETCASGQCLEGNNKNKCTECAIGKYPYNLANGSFECKDCPYKCTKCFPENS